MNSPSRRIFQLLKPLSPLVLEPLKAVCANHELFEPPIFSNRCDGTRFGPRKRIRPTTGQADARPGLRVRPLRLERVRKPQGNIDLNRTIQSGPGDPARLISAFRRYLSWCRSHSIRWHSRRLTNPVASAQRFCDERCRIQRSSGIGAYSWACEYRFRGDVNRDSGDVNNQNRDERGGLEPGLILTFLRSSFLSRSG